MNKHTDIQQQIRSYLNGELDGPAMHRLEREALNDPFLADALEGYGNAAGDQQVNVDELRGRLQQRIEPATRRIIPWRTLSIAASVLVVFTVGGLLLINNKQPDNKANKVLVAAKQEPVNISGAEQPELKPASPQAVEIIPPQKEAEAAPQVAVLRAKRERYEKDKRRADESAKKDDVLKSESMLADMFSKNTASDKAVKDDTIALEDRIVQGFFMTPVEKKEPEQLGYNSKDSVQVSLADKVAGVTTYGAANNRSSRLIGGKITDINGPVIGANISIIGTNFMTRTDKTGRFTVPDATNKVLVVDYLGYQRKKVKVTSQDSILIALQPNNSSLSEVAVVGASKGKTKTLAGKVIDKDGPVAGVAVSIAGTKSGTVTDAQGKFSVQVVPNSSILDVASVGYETKHVKVLDRDSLTVMMQPNYLALNEVVVVKTAKAKPGQPVKGWADFNKYIEDNALSPDGMEGTVKLSFSVNAGGMLGNFKVTKSLSTKTDAEAINLVKAGPDWKPSADGKPVAVSVSIKFVAKK